MVTIQLTGHITEQGKLQVELPEGLPPGEVQVTIEVPSAEEIPWEERPWTEDEIKELLTFTPKTAGEIAASDVIGAWADQGISDPVAWLEEVRRREQERRRW